MKNHWASVFAFAELHIIYQIAKTKLTHTKICVADNVDTNEYDSNCEEVASGLVAAPSYSPVKKMRKCNVGKHCSERGEYRPADAENGRGR